jgi:phage/conjugal plasmid C-4 type zinc finger TraR family protein
MADIIDSASALEDLHRETALSAHRINYSAVSAHECQSCGDELLEARRKAYPGCTMCVSCLSERELRDKQRGI